MQRFIRKITIFSIIIVVLTCKDSTASSGYNLPFDFVPQQYNDNQRINRNEGQQRNINDLKDKRMNNVHIQIFLIIPNRIHANSKIQTNDLRNQEVGNNIPLLGSQQNPISFKIDLDKGTVNELSNSRYLLTRISDEQMTYISDGLDTTALTQNPLRPFHSLLSNDFSEDGGENSKNYAVNLQNTTVLSTKETSLTATRKTVSGDLSDLEKKSTTISIQLTDKINGNNGDETQYRKTLFEFEPSRRYEPNIDVLTVTDKIWPNINFDETSKVVPNIMKETSNHISNFNLNPIAHRFGRLASSHILDYSEFLTKSPSAETITIVPDFGTTLNSSKQISSTTIISINDEETLKQTPTMTKYQQSSGFPFSESKIPKKETDFLKSMIFSTTDRIVVSENILPYESLVTSTASLPKKTPKLIFPNNKNFDTIHDGIKLSPKTVNIGRPSEEKVMMVSSGTISVENTTISKTNFENRTLYFGPAHPIAFIAVGDREILEEQKPQLKFSSVLSKPHIAVGEQISGLQETTDSVEDEATIIERQAALPSLQKQDINIAKNISSYQALKSSRNEIILPDIMSQEAKIVSPDIFFIPEQDFTTSEPVYIELKASVSNIDAKFNESKEEQRESEVLKSESIISPSTQISEPTGHSQLIQPHLPLNLITHEAENDKMNIISRSSEDTKIKLDFKISQTTLPSVTILSKISTIAELTSETKAAKQTYCDVFTINEDECPVANDKFDQTQSDVLFLIDASRNVNKTHFQRAVKVIMDTVEQFKNIGPNGIQVSLVQYAREPVLEFSFRKHNCKPCLLFDIDDTEYIGGLNSVDNVIHKVLKYGFSKRRGDRDKVANILIIISNGISDDRFQETLQLLNLNNISVIVVVVPIEDTNFQLIKQLIKDEEYQNLVFNVTAIEKNQLANGLAERVRIIAKEKSISFEKSTVMAVDESVREFTAYCLSDGFNVTFTFPKSFAGTVAVRGKNVTKDCWKAVQAEQFGKNIEIHEVDLFINFKHCDVKETASVNPAGMNYSTLIYVVHDKWLVTGADEGFFIQCHQPQQPQEQNLSPDLSLQSDFKIAEILPLNSVPSLCNYSIRANAPNGPLVQSAKLGDIVYHRWECENNNQASDLYGLHIHDCYAESKIEQQHIIIDTKGCSTDTNIVSDVIYADDKLIAFSSAKVFKLINSKHLSFHCKLSLCIRKADGCEGITPPRCSRTGHKDLLAYHWNRHNTKSFLAALTVEEKVELTLILPINAINSAFSLQTIKQFSVTRLFWLMVILIALFLAVFLIFSRYITKVNSKDEFIASESLKRHETIHNIVYNIPVPTVNGENLFSIGKRVREQKNVNVSCDRSLKDKKSPEDDNEIRTAVDYDSICGIMPGTEPLYVKLDRHNGSSWSF
ncbi:Cuticlin-6 [Dirofilaria immitis]